MSGYAKANLLGEIANQRGLSLTPGGLLVVNVKVTFRLGDREIPNYIPIKFFGDEAAEIARNFEVGHTVKVEADIKMQKEKGEQYYRPGLYGVSIKHADLVAEMVEEFDATDFEPASVDFGDDLIPF